MKKDKENFLSLFFLSREEKQEKRKTKTEKNEWKIKKEKGKKDGI